MTHEFFQKDTPHGLVKRIMYKKYLQAFIPITQQVETRSPLITVIIDGFAGAGRYGDEWPNKIESYGSPLIALMVSLNYFFRKQHRKDKTWGKQTTDRDTDAEIVDLVATMTLSDGNSGAQLPIEPSIHLYFIEADAENFCSLKENIAEVLDDFFPNPDESYEENEENYENSKIVKSYRFDISYPHYPIVCTLVNADFVKCVTPPEIHRGSVKCLVFLDPFGFTQTPMSHVKRFSGRGNSLLINFMSSYVNRFLSTNEEAIAELFGIEYLHNEIKSGNDVLPNYSSSMEEYSTYLFSQNQCERKPLNNIQSCAAVYEYSLRRIFGTDFSLTFEMRGKNNCIVYNLIFVTDHIKSLEIMKECMKRCSQVENGFSMSDYKFYRNGCQLNFANTQDVSLVADAIYDKFEGCPKVKISEIKDYVLLDTPYLFRKKPLAVMVKENNPRITQVVDAGGKNPSIKGTFPGRTDWVLKFKLKEETINLADELFEYCTMNFVQPVQLSVIMREFSSVPEYSRLHNFIPNALFLLASKGNIDVYYADVEDSNPKLKDIFNSAMEWLIIFRPNPQKMAQLGTNYKRVHFC